ncbi:MAG: DegV family protein [Clostridiales bacterium]|nr:DegV family protein [Clostridiales bacterium]
MFMRIVADSCCDVSPKIQERTKIKLVPVTIQIGDKGYRDDSNLDIDSLMEDMKQSPEAPKTACPSPQDFIDQYKGEEKSVFVVTVSSKLSGTYKSAVLAKDIFLEEIEKKFIYVFDSLSASIGETLVSLKISDLINKGLKENEIVEKVNTYISEMKTFLTVKNLDNLAKSGRISHIVAKVSSIMSVNPIMGSKDGDIVVQEKVLGARRLLKRLVDIIGEQGHNLEDKILGIAHCNCLEKALAFKEEVLKRYNFKEIVIVRTAGASSVYANQGGLVIAF